MLYKDKLYVGFSEGDGESDSEKEEEIIPVQVWVSAEVK